MEVSSKYKTVRTLLQQYLFVPSKHKDVYLAFVLNELAGNTAIVFVSTCANAQRLALALRALGFGAVPMHGQARDETPARHLRDTCETPPRHLRDTSETPARHL